MRLPYGPEEDAIIRALWPVNRATDVAPLIERTAVSVDQRANKLGLKKDPAYTAKGSACFKPGLVPWNKGMNFAAAGRSIETQFKPGTMPHNHKPVGHERITRDGYLERKTAEPKTFRAVHVLAWEAINGPMPAGHALVFRDGRRSTVAAEITAESVELVTRAELMRRNSYHTRYPKEIARLIQLRGALNRQINKRAQA